MHFSGKHVVITGGTGALGTAVVNALVCLWIARLALDPKS